MVQVTKDGLRAALRDWEIARERALLQQQGWGTFLKNQQTLIRSMLDNGWTYQRSMQDVSNASSVHSEELQAAGKNMDERCSSYQELEAKFLQQQASPAA
jgi:hypothetical protein